MLRQEEEMQFRNSHLSDIEIDKDLIVKNPTAKTDEELYDIVDNSDEKDNNNDNTN